MITSWEFALIQPWFRGREVQSAQGACSSAIQIIEVFTVTTEDKSRKEEAMNMRITIKSPLTRALLIAVINLAVPNRQPRLGSVVSPGRQAVLRGGCWGCSASAITLFSSPFFQRQLLSPTSARIKSSRRASPCRGRSRASQPPTAPSTRSSTTRR